jgi:hypothetical protein
MNCDLETSWSKFIEACHSYHEEANNLIVVELASCATEVKGLHTRGLKNTRFTAELNYRLLQKPSVDRKLDNQS